MSRKAHNFIFMIILSSSIFITSCGDESNPAEPGPGSSELDDSDPAGSSTLEPWSGSWRSGESLALSEPMEVVIAAIQEQRTDYTVEEVRDFVQSLITVNFSELEISPPTITFYSGDEILCEAAYTDITPNTNSENVEWQVQEVSQGDCTDYEYLYVSNIISTPPENHFHLRYGPTAEPLFELPWNPSIWSASTTPEWFAEYFSQSVDRLASVLP